MTTATSVEEHRVVHAVQSEDGTPWPEEFCVRSLVLPGGGETSRPAYAAPSRTQIEQAQRRFHVLSERYPAFALQPGDWLRSGTSGHDSQGCGAQSDTVDEVRRARRAARALTDALYEFEFGEPMPESGAAPC